MKSFFCPYCCEEHTFSNCKMKCSYYGSKCKNGVCRDDQGWIPSVSYSKCLKCRDAQTKVYCEVFQKEIPQAFLQGEEFPVALVGACQSGKSSYIATSVYEIRKRMSRTINCMMTYGTEETRSCYDDYYYYPLFEKGYTVGPNQSTDAISLMFPITFCDNKGRPKAIAGLMFKDGFGNRLIDMNEAAAMDSYIANSKGIILFIDPLQIPSVRNQLQGKTPLPVIDSSQTDIFAHVIETIRAKTNIKGAIKTPLAVVVTKIDVLERFDILSSDSCLRQDSEHLKRGAFVLSDCKKVNEELKPLLEDWLGGEMMNMLQHFSKCSIFGVSSLGSTSNGNVLDGGEPKPRRVLDPLLWLLAEYKYIKTEKK